MRVTVKLFATLTRFKSDARFGKAFDIDLSEGSAVRDLIEELKIPHHEPHVIFINNIIVDAEASLNHGDVVGMFPQVGGG
jgi:sulfur-carrier protein